MREDVGLCPTYLLVLWEAVHPLKHPFGHVIPLDQEDGWLVAMTLAQLAHGDSGKIFRAPLRGESKSRAGLAPRTGKG
jgi:hypothetical protein